MQVYFDKEMVRFYKDLARIRKRSFAAILREVLISYQNRIQKKKDTLSEKHQSLLHTIEEARRRFAKAKYHHPKTSDDELLYGK